MPTFSVFLNDLSSRGHELHYFHVESDDLALKSFGDYLYDNIIFFAPETQRFKQITFEDIAEFTQSGGNLLFGGDSSLSDPVREFAESFGVLFEKNSIVDHLEFDPKADVL